ncbi:MAG: hypothetical protein QOG47_62, partial [Mycobacterium sp.]|nr:hypothetical protein [Mycobacterium sp.]
RIRQLREDRVDPCTNLFRVGTYGAAPPARSGSHCSSIVAGATHRCSTLADLHQGPPLQGVARSVIAGLDRESLSVGVA